jgi:hypothetical protein
MPRSIEHRRCLAWIGALVLLCSQAVATGSAAQIRPSSLEITVSWTMPDRFGLDTNHDGRIDLPNSPAYAVAARSWECTPECPAPSFDVRLTGSVTYEGAPVPLRSLEYRWAIDAEATTAMTVTTARPEVTVPLTEGAHEVRLTVVYALPWGTVAVGTTEHVVVEDILVVAIGDSYISGEGNPEVPRIEDGADALWADGVGDDVIEADHAAAHRTTVSWAAQAALQLERTDPATSVTFLSVAAAGATIDRGLLGAQNGTLPEPQIERVAELVGDRRIDLLLVSIGGNDIGFADLIRELVDADPLLDPVCYETDLANVWAAVADGEWNRRSRLAFGRGPFGIGCRVARSDDGRSLAGLDGLPGELARLRPAIASLGAEGVFVMEYPDPTGGNDGVCREIVGDAAPFGLHEISRNEQRLGRELVLDPLNATLAEAAAAFGWTYVEGVADAFAAGHGYCAPWPDYGYPPEYEAAPAILRDRYAHPEAWYRNPGAAGVPTAAFAAGWYRTAGQSSALQGPDSRTETTGTMHPNELGHLTMARLLIEHLGM